MKVLSLIAFVLITVPVFAKTPLRIAYEIESEILGDSKDMRYTKKLIDQGMSRAIVIAANSLRKKGHVDFANEIERDWDEKFGRTFFPVGRDIGDHKGIFQWVNDTYRKIEFILGRDVCVSTHIAAMLTFNSANVVVNPCSFPMDGVPGERIDEYRRHFAGKSPVSDSEYYGVVPEAIYFAVQLGCLVGTSGVGALVCSLAASAGSRAIAMFVAPRLSDRIYTKLCENKDIGDF